jgi:DMSO/TMAO reductase YedYZ heme-binding membrane subunit
MNSTEIITFVGLAAFIIATQMGRRRLSLRRLLLPFLAVGVVAYHYLHSVPTVGGDLDFEISLSLAGALCGVLAARLMNVERDEQTGQIVTQAGVAYAALWAIVFGGRLAFAWGASNLWSHQVMQFSLQHAITGSAAWTAAFILMALSMVLARTAVTAVRALLVDRPQPLPLVNG